MYDACPLRVSYLPISVVPVILNRPSGLVVERSPGVREVVGSIPGRVIPKTLQMVLDAFWLSARNLKDRSRTYGRFPRCRL